MASFRLIVVLITIIAVPSVAMADKMNRMRRAREPGPLIQRTGVAPTVSLRKRLRHERGADPAFQRYAGRRAACLALVNQLEPQRPMSGHVPGMGRRVSGLIRGCMRNGGRMP